MTKTFKNLAIIFMIFEATDGFLTMWAVNHGYVESNALTAPIAGSILLPITKIGMTAIGLLTLSTLARRSPRLAGYGLGACSVFVAAILVCNMLEIIR